ncbi:MAG: glycosyltransferase [Pyrobaculum sp.]|uniref:glycosyltransferase n=1 Tax=Pyrobaculum sp. TaxID=2004705 RepID=UPI00316A1A93
MNIAVVAPQSSHWEDTYRAAAVLVKAFLKLGHKSWLITSIFHDGRPAVDVEAVEKSEGGYVVVEGDVSGVPAIRVISGRSLVPPSAIYLRNFPRVLNAIDEAYGLDAVVVVSSFWNGPEDVARWISIKKSLLAIGEVSKRPFFVYVPVLGGRAPLKKPMEAASRVMWSTLYLPQVLQQVDVVVAVSSNEFYDLRQYRVPEDKIVECRDWVDPDVAELAGAQLERPKQAEGYDFYVSYIGPLDEDRNIRGLIKVAERIASMGNGALIVAGAGEAEEKFRREAEGRKNVILIREHGIRTIASIIRWSLAGVDLAFYEPMGIRALEYLYFGVPYAAPPTSNAAYFITNGVDGIHLESANDIEGFVNWVSTLLREPELRDEMSLKARKKATERTAVKLAETLLMRLAS